MSYDQPVQRTYQIAAVTLSAAAVLDRFVGPAGLSGRVRGVEYLATTGTTVADTLLTIGAAGAVAPVSVTIPVIAIDTGGSMSSAEEAAANAVAATGVNDVLLLADTVIEIASDGGCTAGAADLIITVDWF